MGYRATNRAGIHGIAAHECLNCTLQPSQTLHGTAARSLLPRGVSRLGLGSSLCRPLVPLGGALNPRLLNLQRGASGRRRRHSVVRGPLTGGRTILAAGAPRGGACGCAGQRRLGPGLLRKQGFNVGAARGSVHTGRVGRLLVRRLNTLLLAWLSSPARGRFAGLRHAPIGAGPRCRGTGRCAARCCQPVGVRTATGAVQARGALRRDGPLRRAGRLRRPEGLAIGTLGVSGRTALGGDQRRHIFCGVAHRTTLVWGAGRRTAGRRLRLVISCPHAARRVAGGSGHGCVWRTRASGRLWQRSGWL